MAAIDPPPPLDDELLYAYYAVEADKTEKPKEHPLYKKWSCDAVRLHTGDMAWASMVSGKGIVGMYQSREEAVVRSFIAALMFEHEKEGKLPAIKKKLESEQEEANSASLEDATKLKDNAAEVALQELPSETPASEAGGSPLPEVQTEPVAPVEIPDSTLPTAKIVELSETIQNPAETTHLEDTVDVPDDGDVVPHGEPSMETESAPAAEDKHDSDDGTEADDSESEKQTAKRAGSPVVSDEEAEKDRATTCTTYAAPDPPTVAPLVLDPRVIWAVDSPPVVAPVVPSPLKPVPYALVAPETVPPPVDAGPVAAAALPHVATSPTSTSPVADVIPTIDACSIPSVLHPMAASALATAAPTVLVIPDLDTPMEEANAGNPDGEDSTEQPLKQSLVSKKRKLDDQIVVTVTSQQNRTIELRNPVSGRVQEVFMSATEASEGTNITRYKIIKACQDGGSLVGGRFFRYQYTTPEEEREDQGPTESTSEADEPMPDEPTQKTTEESPNREDDESIRTTERSPSASGNRTLGLAKGIVSPPKVTIQHALLSGGSSKQKARSLPMATGRTPSAELGTKKSSPVALVRESAPDTLPPPFDLSSLRAVRKKTNPAKRPKRIVELIELRTNKVVVCFRGATDVCRALNLDRKDITKACDAEEKTTDKLSFGGGTFTLRYGKEGRVEAYIYGDHREDYVRKGKTESHREIAKRFKYTYAAEKIAGTLGQLPDFLSAVDKSIPEPGAPENMAASTAHTTLGSITTGARAKFGELLGQVDISEDKVDVVSATAGLDAIGLCIVCQSVPPHVVFEPCFHAVLCSLCAEVACRSFCPICQTSIQSRVQPKTATLARPRIFSAYSFL